jgi:hypothetical protein
VSLRFPYQKYPDPQAPRRLLLCSLGSRQYCAPHKELTAFKAIRRHHRFRSDKLCFPCVDRAGHRIGRRKRRAHADARRRRSVQDISPRYLAVHSRRSRYDSCGVFIRTATRWPARHGWLFRAFQDHIRSHSTVCRTGTPPSGLELQQSTPAPSLRSTTLRVTL